MKAATLLLIFADVVTLLKNKGLITDTDDFGDFSNLTNDLELVKELETILSKYGVVVPNRVDKILALIPLVADLIKG